MKKDPQKVANAYKGLLDKNKTETSPRFHIGRDDVNKWLKNTALFLAPALILFLTQMQQGVPYQDAIKVLYLWGINTLIDLTRKWLTENTYKVSAP